MKEGWRKKKDPSVGGSSPIQKEMFEVNICFCNYFWKELYDIASLRWQTEPYPSYQTLGALLYGLTMGKPRIALEQSTSRGQCCTSLGPRLIGKQLSNNPRAVWRVSFGPVFSGFYWLRPSDLAIISWSAETRYQRFLPARQDYHQLINYKND